jgi:phage tail-like protein
MSAPSLPSDRESGYLDYLPAVFREDLADGSSNVLGRLLLAFEHVLTGVGDADDAGFEEILDGIVGVGGAKLLGGLERYFDSGVRRDDAFVAPAEAAPAPFLDWLAGWVAFVPRSDSSVSSDPDVRAVERERITRRLIAHSVELYRKRGTAQGLADLLAVYALGVRIEEPAGWFQLGVNSTIGRDTSLDGTRPHFFRVVLTIPPGLTGPLKEEIDRRVSLLTEIVAAEKPAHTSFEIGLDTETSFQLEVHSTIGVDTLLV